MSKYDELVIKLKEIFQIDKPELDFGVYRILNTRAAEVNDYLENRLKAKVLASLAASGAPTEQALRLELKEKEAQYQADGINPDSVPKILEIRQKLSDYNANRFEHENAVFSHLLNFFSRYYDKGDFISQRRYKGDTYAIPYAGEEVVLHWANKDQYYTKSGENFANYAFKLDDGRTVRFQLVAADTAKDNRKDNDKERRFVLMEAHTRTVIDADGEEHAEQLEPVTEENGELLLRFAYQAMPKGSKQDELMAQAAQTILNHPIVKARWLDLTQRAPTEKNPLRTVLEKALGHYTSKNSADYFIHKDLGGFLRRELDFYIKTEVMQLDDVQAAATFADIERNLRMIQVLREIALDLIAFLAQLEDFQKKLWLKKKFIVAAHYCITLDRIIEHAPDLLKTIAANPKQWEQWQGLGLLNGEADLFSLSQTGSVDYLREHPYLMADTALFDPSFKAALLAALDNLDESLDGLLVHGDNFQALNLLQERYREQVKCIYIDPPYNTDSSEIAYKNGYRSSSWVSLLHNRFIQSKHLMKEDGVLCATIDDQQQKELSFILDEQFGQENYLGTIAIRINPSGRITLRGFAQCHEYGIFYGKSLKSSISKLTRSDEQLERFNQEDEKGVFEWRNFRREGSASERFSRPKRHFPIYVENGKFRIPKLKWNDDNNSYEVLDKPKDCEIEIYPIDAQGTERVWRWGLERISRESTEVVPKINQRGDLQVYYKYRPNEEGVLPQTIWVDKKFSATEYGTALLKALFSTRNEFSFPKSIFALEDSVKIMLGNRRDGIVLDYFAGSGTTGHAVISLNRLDEGTRKYILVEQGEYFDTAIKPRLQKVIYSADWKNGQPTAPHTGISHAFKVLKIESYEDTLNNLELRREQGQTDLIRSLPQTSQDDYLLRYMLNIESRGSLLSVDAFRKPFDFSLNIAVDSAGAYQRQAVDLVETFNYLIGLKVKHIDLHIPQGFAWVGGWLPGGETALVLWRDLDVVDYAALNRLCERLALNPADSEYDVVYINGDHNIPTVFTSLASEGGATKRLKIRQIEPEFLRRMFDVETL